MECITAAAGQVVDVDITTGLILHFLGSIMVVAMIQRKNFSY